MSKWEIDKTIECCYGHRVFTQTLNGEFADNLKCSCRHLHGHEGKIQVYLTGDTLDQTGMVTDFRHLEWLKKWVNEFVDHRFILARQDPLYDQLIGERKLAPVIIPDTSFIAGYQIVLDDIEPNTPDYEYFEGFLIVDFVPTSEKLSQWMARLVSAKMARIGIKVSRIDWWETPKSRSSFVC